MIKIEEYIAKDYMETEYKKRKARVKKWFKAKNKGFRQVRHRDE